jgi:AraC family transcriptional regulator
MPSICLALNTITGAHKADNKEVMEARLEEDLRLDELAREAGLSTLHFIRSSRESTGKTPYQFLLGQRVEGELTLMRDHGASLT